MTSKPEAKAGKKLLGIVHPGMMGDGTEEQNLSERGDPAARITKAEVDAAFSETVKPKPGAVR
ncbi:hypothetical protein [Bosea sp. R86505]|uniref:hypothetical protein n=1 Tax=Bosea sp. R86505 TaxID=3101710 RepID=UPI00366D6850